MDVSRGTTSCLCQAGFAPRRQGDAKKFPPLAGMVSRRETVFSFKLRPKGNGVPRWRGWRAAPGVDLQEIGQLSSSVLVYLSKGFGYALV